MITYLGQTLNPMYRFMKQATFRLSPFDVRGNKVARQLYVNFAGGDPKLKMAEFKVATEVVPDARNSCLEVLYRKLSRQQLAQQLRAEPHLRRGAHRLPQGVQPRRRVRPRPVRGRGGVRRRARLHCILQVNQPRLNDCSGRQWHFSKNHSVRRGAGDVSIMMRHAAVRRSLESVEQQVDLCLGAKAMFFFNTVNQRYTLAVLPSHLTCDQPKIAAALGTSHNKLRFATEEKSSKSPAASQALSRPCPPSSPYPSICSWIPRCAKAPPPSRSREMNRSGRCSWRTKCDSKT